MLKEVKIVKYKCEKCESMVSRDDKFCRECGHNLETVLKYKEVTEGFRMN